MNPRSVYNKIKEFHEFVRNEDIDVIFMSESWERENKTLGEIVNLEDHEVISNVHQREGKGGRPALIVNKKKYDVKTLTNTLVPVKWGVEAVWALLTPKNVSQTSKIQKIVCAAVYSKPGSKSKSDLLDHISDAFHIVNTKYGKGLHIIIAGDTNELRIKPILDLSPNLVQIVNKPTRVDKITGKEAILDPIIMTLAQYYQVPEILQPLDADPDLNGKPSDHKLVKVKPVSTINNKSARVTRAIEVQPITETGIRNMKHWLIQEDWTDVLEADSANKKAEIFQNTLASKYNEFFPKKSIKVSNDDQPWITQKLKDLDRHRKRVYHKNRRSDKYMKIDKQFKKGFKISKT